MAREVKTVASLALLYAFRMIGLFMVLPILVVYGRDYAGASPKLLGLALGIYGLTQAIFQIPLGLLSDIWGRKIVITLGLVVFALGSVLAATATSIEGLILGRALQGAGAIASAIMAMVADLTSEQNRTKAMAAIGASIGLSFSVSMILGPVIASVAGLSGVFFLAAILAVCGIGIVLFVVPTPQQSSSHRENGAIPSIFVSTIKNTQLLRLDVGIFALHCILMASFVAIPTVLESSLDLSKGKHWQVYLPVLLLAFIAMLPLMIVAEKKRKVKPVFLLAIAIVGVSNLLLSFSLSSSVLVIAFVFSFFVGFNLLEAMLPSLVSKISPAGAKGTAMGIYSTSQFLGAFCGGVLGGFLLEDASIASVFLATASLAGVWLAVAGSMAPPKHLTSLCLPVEQGFTAEQDVAQLPGVEEVLYVVEESLLYLKVDKARLDELQLVKLTNAEAVS
ncbi:Inner membrane transport protein YajR [Thalassocella blandensis]|nr:Inner membrane transport protein YajR [Thalassocella blandensis]